MFKNYFEDIYRLAKSGTPEDMQTLKRLLEEKACIDEHKTGSARLLSAAACLAQENNQEGVARLRELGANEENIAYGYGLQGSRDYQLVALGGVYVRAFAFGAANGGHRDLCEELYKNNPTTLIDIAAGAAFRKDRVYLEILCTRPGVNFNLVAKNLAWSGDREYAEAWRIKHKIIPSTMAEAAAAGRNREYAESLRTLSGVTDFDLASGAVLGGDCEYAETFRQMAPDMSNKLALIASRFGHRAYAEFLRKLPGVDVDLMAKAAARGNHHAYAKFLASLPKTNQNAAVTAIHSSQISAPAAASSSSSTIQSSAITNRPSPSPATSHSASRNQLQPKQFLKPHPKPNQSAGLQSVQLAAPQSKPAATSAPLMAAASSSSSRLPSVTQVSHIPNLTYFADASALQQLQARIAALEAHNKSLNDELRHAHHQLELVTTELNGKDELLREKDRVISMQQQLLDRPQVPSQQNEHKRTADPAPNPEAQRPIQRQKIAVSLSHSGLGVLPRNSQPMAEGENERDSQERVNIKIEPK